MAFFSREIKESNIHFYVNYSKSDAIHVKESAMLVVLVFNWMDSSTNDKEYQPSAVVANILVILNKIYDIFARSSSSTFVFHYTAVRVRLSPSMAKVLPLLPMELVSRVILLEVSVYRIASR